MQETISRMILEKQSDADDSIEQRTSEGVEIKFLFV